MSSVGAKEKAKEPTRIQPSRTVKTKEYREAHHTSWSVHTHHLPKDPNMYYALTLSALVQLRNEERNATLPRVLEIVKSKVVSGAYSVRSKVHAAVQKMIESGRAVVNSRGVITLKSKHSTAPKRTSSKRKTTKRTTDKKKKATTSRKKATDKKKKETTTRKKKATKATKAKTTKRGKSKEVEEAPAPKKARRGKAAAAAEEVEDNNVAEEYMWEYKERDNWFPYTKEASDIVEAAYKDFLSDPGVDVRSVKSGMWSYQVDFTNMTQTNIQHENHTVRDIRRVPVPSE